MTACSNERRPREDSPDGKGWRCHPTSACTVATPQAVTSVWLLLGLAALGHGQPVSSREAEPIRSPILGATVCDFLAHQTWGRRAPGWHPLEELARHGVHWVRVGVTTRNCPQLRKTEEWGSLAWRGEYWSCLEYATRILRMAAAARMRLDVFLFLSDRAAHGGRQRLPQEWAGLSLKEVCERVQRHCFETATHFRESGLNVEVYEIGNEIERGVLGFPRFATDEPIDWLRMMREDPAWLRENVWRPEAALLKAATRGVKRAQPSAEVLLHIATMPPPNDAYVTTFFEAMVAEGVRFDYAGLSVYPRGSAWADWKQSVARWARDLEALGKPVVISEFSYPHSPGPGIAEGAARQPLLGFPPTPEGQARFVGDFLTWCRQTRNVAGAFYFYADHIPGWGENPLPGLFLSGDPPRPAPALSAFR